MKTIVKIISGTVLTLLISGTAVAGQPVNKDVTPAALTELAVPVRFDVKSYDVKSIVATSPKRKMRIVREALPGQNKATRTNNQGRFVIATDASRDVMTVYKTVKHSKAMPNLFKN